MAAGMFGGLMDEDTAIAIAKAINGVGGGTTKAMTMPPEIAQVLIKLQEKKVEEDDICLCAHSYKVFLSYGDSELELFNNMQHLAEAHDLLICAHANMLVMQVFEGAMNTIYQLCEKYGVADPFPPEFEKTAIESNVQRATKQYHTLKAKLDDARG